MSEYGMTVEDIRQRSNRYWDGDTSAAQLDVSILLGRLERTEREREDARVRYTRLWEQVVIVLELLDLNGVWTGADDDVLDRINAVILDRDGWKQKYEALKEAQS